MGARCGDGVRWPLHVLLQWHCSFFRDWKHLERFDRPASVGVARWGWELLPRSARRDEHLQSGIIFQRSPEHLSRREQWQVFDGESTIVRSVADKFGEL